jgi:hypothetical protein
VIQIGTHIFVALPLFELQSAARLCFRHYSSIGVSALASQPVPCVAVKDATIDADGGDSGALRTSKSWWNGAAMYARDGELHKANLAYVRSLLLSASKSALQRSPAYRASCV